VITVPAVTVKQHTMTTSTKRPNILIIVADDLGFSDTSPYGSEISTPALDRLAKDGLRMTDFHTAPACSPTRAMLFSGTDSHIAGLGQMAEFMMKNPESYKGVPGYEGYLNFRVAALSEILQDAGYHTLMAGKWHLGMKPELSPHTRGFNRAAAYLPGAGNHYNYEPQFEESMRLPPMMKSDGFWMEGSQPLDRHTLPADFYSSNYFASRLIGYLRDRTDEELEKPFFAYLAFTAPHWPLQAPKETISKYHGKYDDGPEALRLRRLKQLQLLKLVPDDITPAPLDAALWHAMSEHEQKISAKKMEVYAAMVDKLDENVGRVLDQLEATGELNNTFIVFMSDNGAEGNSLEAIPLLGSMSMAELITKHYNNAPENIGAGSSFVWYGPDWALAATAPSRGFKGWTTEGGIRCPCIVRYPPLKRTGVSHDFATVMDLLPTCLELAGVQHPGSMFRGREVAPVRGKSWVPHLSSQNGPPTYQAELDVTGWELFGLRGIRRGNYKAVWIPPPKGKGEWELFNVVKDPGELQDLAEIHKDILKGLLVDWEIYFAETGMIEVDMSKASVAAA
jgi:arylsulfatase A-like enzyme